MFIFKIKREQAQFTAKNSAQTVHVYIFHNLSIYSCSAEERELKNMLKKSLTLMGITGVALTMLALGLAAPLAKIFVGYDEGLLNLTRHAFSIFSFSFLLSGLNIFASGFFTALNNGLISAVISFARTLVFQAACVLLLPAMFGVDGIWYATLVAEGLACLLSLWLIDRKKHFYHYL